MAISFDYIPASQAASANLIEEAPNTKTGLSAVLPQRVTFPAQYNSGKTPTVNVPVQIFSLADIQTRAGRGSMAALVYEALSRTYSGDIYWGPIADDAGGVVATKTITIATAATSAGPKSFLIAGRKITFAVANGDTANTQATNLAAAINADLDNPFTAAAASAVVTLTARNKGALAQSYIIIPDPDTGDANAAPTGTTYTIANGTIGTTDPSLDTFLANLGADAHTVPINPYPSSSLTQVASFETAWTARNMPSVKRPFAMIMGYTDTLANFATWLSSRNSPAVTAVPVEGSPSPCWMIAATAAGRLATSAASKPGVPVKGARKATLPGVYGNAAYASWTGDQRNTIVNAGGSWTGMNISGVVYIGDLVTTYKTNAQLVNDAAAKWRFTETISNVQYKIYSIDTLIGSDQYANAVIVDDASRASADYVIRPSTLKADIWGLIDDWELRGLTKNAKTVKAGVVVEIDSGNPNRMNFYIPDNLAAGLRVIAGKYVWAFV